MCVCVDAQTVLCLRFLPVMHRHQLALCESEKEGSLSEVEAHSRPSPASFAIIGSLYLWLTPKINTKV